MRRDPAAIRVMILRQRDTQCRFHYIRIARADIAAARQFRPKFRSSHARGEDFQAIHGLSGISAPYAWHSIGQNSLTNVSEMTVPVAM